MAFRTKKWYRDTIKREEATIERVQESLAGYINSADYAQAAQKCTELRTALLSLNTCENMLADMDDEDTEAA